MKTANGKRAIFAAGIAIALPFGLAACGDDEDTDDDTVDITDNQDENLDQDGGDQSDDSDEDTIIENDDPSESDGDGSSPDEGDDSSDDALNGGSSIGDGEKPSRDEVHEGIEIMLSEQLSSIGVTPEQIEAAGIGPAIEDYYTCVVDGVYDNTSAETLSTIASGDPDAPIYGEDFQTLTDASNSCIETELEPAMP